MRNDRGARRKMVFAHTVLGSTHTNTHTPWFCVSVLVYDTGTFERKPWVGESLVVGQGTAGGGTCRSMYKIPGLGRGTSRRPPHLTP